MKKNSRIIKYIIFAIFIILNFVLTLKHEPWRDEIHAWTMAKYLSLGDLFTVSRFDRSSCFMAFNSYAIC